MEFRLLGPMAVNCDCISLPTAPKPRKVLALLLLHANRPVPISTLVEELWDDHPPASAVRTLQTYIFQLRRHFSDLDGCPPCPSRAGLGPDHRFIVTGASSYLLRIDDGVLDVQEFQRLSQAGRTALGEGRPGEAGELLGRALSLWRGPALADVTPGRPLRMHSVRLEEDRHAVLEARIEADLLAGRPYHELLGELSSLLVEDPLNEGICHRLMTVLCLAGRRSEAITVYHRLRSRLVDEFGMDPCGELRELYERVLRDDLLSPRARESAPLQSVSL
ncbi:BTAD domain-containing putative transcriptional regulator [Streptomyces sp. NPDC050287]|uniref:AfsR/SARP family transcriptional regulator n=1 Tax=Streptomyces sp. NPDC050287 TaxID=3365608 RepID=UPI0037BD9EFF